MADLPPASLTDVQRARKRVNGLVIRPPLLRLPRCTTTGSPTMAQGEIACELYLKPENLQPTGSFKIRGAANALLTLLECQKVQTVWTASAGNMALALAWVCRQVGVACTAIVPDDAPAVKVEAIRQQGAQVLPVPFREYQQIQRTHIPCETNYRDFLGPLIHPFADPAVMAGNGIIGLEIIEELPEVEAIFVPYGGGGLSCGIAAAAHLLKPSVKVYACEVETAAPLAASWAAGRPVSTAFTPSFISGMGAPFVFEQMWPLAQRLLDGVVVVSLAQVKAAIRLLAQQAHLVAEGAGAVAVAAACAASQNPAIILGTAPSCVNADQVPRKAVALVSGGNIDPQLFLSILEENHDPS